MAGTINQRGSFIIRAAQVGSETVLARIIAMVQEAQGSKAPVQRIVDRITGIFVPVVLGIAILTFVLWVTIGGSEYISYGILSAVSVLVIACPCALGLATPTALMVGIGKAASQHILIKDAVALEQMRKVDVVVLDKTGTLTEGHPTATGWLWAQSQEPHFKDVLLAAEMKSEHPLAGAIVSALQDEEKIKPAALDSFESITGKGIKASYEGHTYWVGSHKLLKDFSATVSDVMAEMLVHYESDGNGIIYFGRENELLAIIAVSDPIKATSAEAVKELKRQGIDICMLTGDGQRTALTVSSRLGIERFVADALPDDKAEFVRELQMQGKKVAMVGDGINDSQALALADVSIAMGKGTDIAMDVAMVTLMTSDLLLLPKAFQLSKQTVKLIHQNLFWAFIYNLIGIPIAAGILFPLNGLLLNPMLASAAMAFSSVSVVLNELVESCKKARESGIYVALIDSSINQCEFDACYMTDNVEAGQMAAKEMLGLLNEAGNLPSEELEVGIMLSSDTSQAMINRVSGFLEYWSGHSPEKWEIAQDIYLNGGNVEKAQSDASKLIDQHENLKGILGCSNTSTIGIAGELLEENRKDIVLVGFDMADITVQIIQNPDYFAGTLMQRQDQMGYLGLTALYDFVSGGRYEQKYFDTGVVLIDADYLSGRE